MPIIDNWPAGRSRCKDSSVQSRQCRGRVDNWTSMLASNSNIHSCHQRSCWTENKIATTTTTTITAIYKFFSYYNVLRFRHNGIQIQSGHYWGHQEMTQPVRWPLFCHCRVNAVEQSAWTASATGHHLRTIQTIVENNYVWLVGPQRPVSER